jgi:outer membrane receptor protein involved in Fe transport
MFDGVLLATVSQRQTASIEESHVFSPSVVNSARIGFNRIVAEQVQSLSTINPLADNPSYGFVPGRDVGQISIAGFTTYPGGLRAMGDYVFAYTSYQVDDDLSITRGSHSLRTGLAFERIQSNTLETGNTNGTVSFGSLASFLTDQPSSFQATIPGTSIPEGLRQSVVGAYLQDDWRVLRNLTLNLGVRYEMACPPKSTTGWGRWFMGHSSSSWGRPISIIQRGATSLPAWVLPGIRSEMAKQPCGPPSANTTSCL